MHVLQLITRIENYKSAVPTFQSKRYTAQEAQKIEGENKHNLHSLSVDKSELALEDVLISKDWLLVLNDLFLMHHFLNPLRQVQIAPIKSYNPLACISGASCYH